MATWITNPNNVVYVAADGEQILGVAAMERSGRISLNHVSPDARFKGVSKALLTGLERKAKELGLAHCILESTQTALRFYRAAGYREQERYVPRSRLPAEAESGLPMVKDLT